MRGHIKIFTLQMGVGRSYRLNTARASTACIQDRSHMLSMDLKVSSLQELISGK